ncbi:D-2-hydroxyacid dehydrogenase [Nitrogeniibacter mangrovi]|uniref:D-2-hydroxyacid dehydrogenase n=1 Tax=Nitrogeniibacter mangrovi TaxID=2016596 RepID=A0A6C1B5H7_9RHOO|nr:D-2-hydroxyacid dehydrogenase [Nitrogeniibacter mangrovi]QID18976.1 D-2-hydroxyacid dehydrogenase [Nitrogeniibacter mangrovi]
MTYRIVMLERDSVDAVFRAPTAAHTWVDYPFTEAGEVIERLRGADIVVLNKAFLGAAEFAALPELKMVAIAATGSDNVDLDACRARGIVVSNVRGYAATTVPEHVLALMFALARQLPAYMADVASGRWSRSRNFCLLDHPVRDLAGSTLGIVGAGSLGQGVAKRATALGMHVLLAERPGATAVRDGRVAFDEVLARADVLSLHCPLTEATRHLINARTLGAMKPSAFLINTARGGLVDEAALVQALRTGRIAGAAVDVLSSEPPDPANPLLDPDVPNLIVTPHVAWASAQAMQALADQVVDNIDAFAAGMPRHRLA